MIRHAAAYATETISNAGRLSRSLNGHSNESVNDYLRNQRSYSSSAMGTLGTAFYDIATGGENRDERYKVRRNSSRLLLLTDIADDVIDKGKMTVEEKCKFLDKVHSNLFGYSSHSSRHIQEEASYYLAGLICNELSLGGSRMESIFDTLVGVIEEQLTEENPEQLLRIAKTIGAMCSDAVATITEIVTGNDFPETREAARRIGEYCELLDNWFELNNDLIEGVNTFPTVMIRTDGDSHLTRKRIRTTCLGMADESFEKGISALSKKEQRNIYKAIKAMIDVKYRVVTRLGY